MRLKNFAFLLISALALSGCNQKNTEQAEVVNLAITPAETAEAEPSMTEAERQEAQNFYKWMERLKACPNPDETLDYDSFPSVAVLNCQASPDGYPVFMIECNDEVDECYGESGQPIGTKRETAELLTKVRNNDVVRRDWSCDVICTDQDGNVVGKVSKEMEQWFRDNNVQ